jgi:hypothetical protein
VGVIVHSDKQVPVIFTPRTISETALTCNPSLGFNVRVELNNTVLVPQELVEPTQPDQLLISHAGTTGSHELAVVT